LGRGSKIWSHLRRIFRNINDSIGDHQKLGLLVIESHLTVWRQTNLA